MLELILFVLLGCIFGVFTGLFPGIHVNTIALLILWFLPEFNLAFALFTVAMSAMHSFIDFIPGILLGAPDSETFLSVLPGHAYLLEGKSHKAIMLTVFGGFFSSLFAIPLIFVFAFIAVTYINLIKILIPWVLIFILILMVFSEKYLERKLMVLLIILITGILGLIVFESSLSVKNGLFAAITGMFGFSTMLNSIKNNPKIPKQEIIRIKFSKDLTKFGLLSSLLGFFTSIFPSIGSSQGVFVLKKFLGKISKDNYFIMIGGANTSNLLFSFAALYFLGSTRTGASLAVKQFIPVTSENFYMIMLTFLFTAFLAVFLTDILSRALISKVSSIDYFKMNVAILVILSAISIMLTNAFGIIVLFCSAMAGLFTVTMEIKRTTGMAFLMVPTILFYLGF